MNLKIFPVFSFLNCSLKNTNVNFKGNSKLKSQYDTSILNSFNPEEPSGLDYRFLNSFPATRIRTINEMKEAYKNGEDISVDREALIYSRTKTAVNDEQKFVIEHPEFESELDDICQELTLIMITCTNKEIEGAVKVTAPIYYAHLRNIYFENILANKEHDISDAEKCEAKEEAVIERYIDEIPLLRQAVDEVLEGLSVRQQAVIRCCFGIDDGIPKSQSKAAKYFGCPKKAIENIYEKAIGYLKSSSRKKFKDYYDS